MSEVSEAAPDTASSRVEETTGSDSPADPLAAARATIRARYGRSEPDIVAELLAEVPLDESERETVTREAIDVVETLRNQNAPTMMESFLGEYGLSTKEGVGLMCLAEALLRVPDATTIDELIADKLEDSDWSSHLGHSSSPLVNASTWALMLTGRVLDDEERGGGPIAALRPLVRRLGEPVVRKAVGQAMKILGKQFVLGRDIEEAMDEARTLEKRGYTYSYDMLGEAARTDADAKRYHAAYAHAIEELSKVKGADIRDRPGISVKLSALHPRYEWTHRDEVFSTLLPRARTLAIAAAKAGVGFNVDAEEADRLELSMDLIEELLATPELAGWDGFGVVVQAYGRRALPLIDWLVALARREQRRIMVRLVKGAYWDTEVKEAQVLGLASFPVFTRKANTDLSYLVCARHLLDARDVVYPQFATHNAHTVVAVHHMAGEDSSGYEFQRLHGMGESLHETIRGRHRTRCRIYAPVGAHQDLLAYLVRRLLENGANSSFVNQIVDESVPAAEVAADPIAAVEAEPEAVHPAIAHPSAIYAPRRANSKGFRITDPASVLPLLDAREAFADTTWEAAPMIAGEAQGGESRSCRSPSDPSREIGRCTDASEADVDTAMSAAIDAAAAWRTRSASERGAILNEAADRYEANVAELCALLCREGGKTLADGIAEVREAVDFLRYYAVEAERIENRGSRHARPGAHGVIACISPWNFPFAIFTGQIAGALSVGNVVLAKPAEQTPLISARAVSLLREAGLPEEVLQLLPGGGEIGAKLTADPRLDGVCFTGSTETARLIERALAKRTPEDVARGATPDPMLIAETGGLNAMIVDSSALPEQVVRDVIVSSFQSAGQRCSALRMLYVQKEAEKRTLEMLEGALDALSIGDPWDISTDVGPVIDEEAKEGIVSWIEEQREAGRLSHEGEAPSTGCFVAPTIVRVSGIEALEREVFGPVLHVATFEAEAIEDVVADINARGYGLTFGLHTRIDDRVQRVVERIRVGNVYVNRNQIGAIVGSQPFGGEGLSGTGPKAGGPLYLRRFVRPPDVGGGTANGTQAPVAAKDRAADGAGDGITGMDETATSSPNRSSAGGKSVDAKALEQALAALPAPGPVNRGHGVNAGGLVLPGPTGESNRLEVGARGPVLLVGDDPVLGLAQVSDARAAGCPVLLVTASEALADAVEGEWDGDEAVSIRRGQVSGEAVTALPELALLAVASEDPATIIGWRRALAAREGAIVPLVADAGEVARYVHERHVCIDTTAAGGNASLLAASA